ncbi:PREDICTED: protein LURP-one-related 12-like [Camelina sativa]|uniref:Protein LURP-one-related 12-like n=1 Tax=Camelina sativa TaxID=90675 RepID=A0ABM0W4I6_CAMSA|nr:PREDICTED: protein LURP-one-related 12-like [Camelina sativa]
MELVEETNPKEGKKMGGRIVVDKAYLYEEDKPLTVCKTSLFYTGDGFAAYDCHGDIIFRVDSYGPDTRDNDEIVLMDATGKCLLTVKRKRPTLHQRWEGFLGERSDGQKPIFSVRRSSIIGRCTMEIDVFDGTGEEYIIDGDFSQRSCLIYDTEKRTVAEIKRKVDASTNVMLGRDVFTLEIKPGFDGAFAMGLVVVLDQINGDDPVEIGDEQVHPFVED